MKRSIRLAPKALSDLDGIWAYSVENFGEARSEAYVRAINAALELLVHNPQAARDASHIRVGLLKYNVGSHVIFFRLQNGGLVVSRILHSSMDFARHL
jgi:toxin ParE1/3/4